MITLEQVEKLREKSSVGYEDAKAALEASGGDMLDAMVWLERNGKIGEKKTGSYSSGGQKDTGASSQSREQSGGGNGAETPNETFGQTFQRFLNWLGRVFQKGNRSSFDVYNDREARILTLPMTAFVLLLILLFPLTLVLLVIGLFCGCRYSYREERNI